MSDPAGPASTPGSPPPAPLPLAGVTVVSLEQAVAAPFATRQLADLGARVIKIERPAGGDFARRYDEAVRGQSSYFVWLNRSKESLTLDIKAPAGRAILDDLLAGADVLVQNLAPGAATRLGLDAAPLADRYPRLIPCSITGYGPDGPWATRKAYDLLVQCETGLVSITGSPGEPARAGISVADIAAGMYAYTGILTALYRRATTGLATAVHVSLFEALGEWMGSPAYYTRYGGRQPTRAGARHATIAPYGPFTTAGHDTVLIAIQNEREWQAFCEIVFGDAALAADRRFVTNSARVAHRDTLDGLISARFGALDTDAALGLLDQAGVASARMNSVAEFLDHPVLAGRDRWRTVGTPGGPVEALLPPVGLVGVEPVMNPVPAAGQHTDAILGGLGRTRMTSPRCAPTGSSEPPGLSSAAAEPLQRRTSSVSELTEDERAIVGTVASFADRDVRPVVREAAYKVLARELRRAILQRRYSNGARLPTEAELARDYQVSRQTVRRAFHDLVAEGMVYRVPGRGTFAAPGDGQYLRQFGSIEDLMGLSVDTRLEVLRPLRRQVSIDAASRLRLESDAVHVIVFRRTHGGEPFCHTAVYLHPTAGASLHDVAELRQPGATSEATIIGLLDTRLAAPIAEAEQSITAAAADPALAGALGCQPGEPLLRVDRIYLTTDGQPIELSISHFLPEQYSYRVRLRRSVT